VIRRYVRIHAAEFRSAVALLLPYLLPAWRVYAGLFLLSWLDIALTVSSAWFFGSLTDAAFHGDVAAFRWQIPLGMALLMLSVCSVAATPYLEVKAESGIRCALKNDLLRHILLLPAAQLSDHHGGDLMSRFTHDVYQLDGMTGRSLIQVVKLPLLYAAVFVYLSHLNVQLAVVAAAAAPAALAAGLILGLSLRRNSRRVNSLFGEMNGHLSETFAGLPIIRSFILERSRLRRFSRQNEELYDLERKNAVLRGAFHSGGYVFSYCMFLVCLALGAYRVSAGTMTVGSMIAFVNLVHYLIAPLSGLAELWAGFQRSCAAADRIVQVLRRPAEAAELPVRVRPPVLTGAIFLQQVTFGYGGGIPLFQRLDLRIPAGKVTAVVGRSGAGKSTLLQLLQGDCVPDGGNVWLDQIALQTLTPSERRSCFAWVSQETMLFSGTIRDNLLLARPGASEAELVDAARHANIHDYIRSLPEGYDTEIGERGVRLSGGQRQRLAIARAVLKNAPILLLDEPTSALDASTEEEVRAALARLMRHRTTIIVTHRMSLIRDADFIVVMEQGHVVQTGRHEELVVKAGPYRELSLLHLEKGAVGS
jgi:ABC-type multidrug transport system fused ATPase/permease subunit